MTRPLGRPDARANHLEYLQGGPKYRDEPTSETTNDVYARWNAPLVFMAGSLSP